MRNRLHVVRDGVEALAFLHRESPYEDAVRPDLIFLDLHLPKLDGRRVLSAIKADPALMTIPVVVLSSSVAPRDIGQLYSIGANSYVTKPVGLERFIQAVQTIEQFWFVAVELPPRWA
ncbi:MAG: response regulator [Haliangiales bacterium]